jgi:hypothetical protein
MNRITLQQYKHLSSRRKAGMGQMAWRFVLAVIPELKTTDLADQRR